MSIVNLNLNLKTELFKICVNKKILPINRFFSLAVKKKKLTKAKEILSYSFYDSPDYQPVKRISMFNTLKPVFIDKINKFGDLPSVLLKNSKWFFYWSDLISYWKKKKFLFLGRNLENLRMLDIGPIDINKYLELPLGISYSNFWGSFGLTLGFNNNDYKWLTIILNDGNMLSDEVLKRMFKTDVQILLRKGWSECIILVRSDVSLNEFCFHGFKCKLKKSLRICESLTLYRASKKKWVWLPTELTDFIYFVQNTNKRCFFYQHIGGVIKKIGKAKFDLFKKTLPVKVRKGVGFEVII